MFYRSVLNKSDLKNIFEKYYKSLVMYANRFLPLKSECEDLIQDIFVTLWKKNIIPRRNFNKNLSVQSCT